MGTIGPGVWAEKTAASVMPSDRFQEAHLPQHISLSGLRFPDSKQQAHISGSRHCFQEAAVRHVWFSPAHFLNLALSCVQSTITLVVSFESESNPVKWARMVLLSPINRTRHGDSEACLVPVKEPRKASLSHLTDDATGELRLIQENVAKNEQGQD